MGIDPGYGRTGIAIIRFIENKSPEAVFVSTLETNPSLEREKRYLQLYNQIENIIQSYSICLAGIENIYLKKNMKNMHYNIEARGVIIYLITKYNIPIEYFQPKSIKKALTNNGNASKKQVQKMVQNLLQLKEIPEPDDSADAAAIALATWLHRRNYDCPN